MTESAQALGKWQNAPLALVLAQIRFEPFAEMSPQQLSDAFYPEVETEFPQLNPIQQFTIHIGAQPPDQQPNQFPQVSGYDLLSDSGTRVVRLQPGVLTYTVTSYWDYPLFSAEWNRLLTALCKVGDVKALRMGLRYVDFIIPSTSRVPEDYVIAPLGVSPITEEEHSPVVFNLYEYERNIGKLRIQYGRGFGPPEYPLDLQGMVIPPSNLRARYTEGVSAVLDMDRWMELTSTVMQQAEISQNFQNMHDDMSKVFKHITTPLAHHEWDSTD